MNGDKELVSTLKTIIKEFRCIELQLLLRNCNVSTNGKKKKDMVRSAFHILDSNPNPDVIEHIFNINHQLKTNPGKVLEKKEEIKETENTMQRRSTRLSTTNLTEEGFGKFVIPMVRTNSQITSQTRSRHNGYEEIFPPRLLPGEKRNPLQDMNLTFVDREPIRLPRYPLSFLRGNPFYQLRPDCVVRYPEILEPGILPLFPKRIYDKRYGFNLTLPQLNDINLNRRKNFLQPAEYVVQVLLRFFEIQSVNWSTYNGAPLDDSLPAHLSIHVNGQPIQLPALLPSNKPGMDGRRSPRVINITDKINLGGSVSSCNNDLLISWMHSSAQLFAFSLHLVRKISIKELCDNLEKTQIAQESKTKDIIREKLCVEDDDIMMSNTLPASLNCPLGMSRMALPVRSNNCSHLQCFDAFLYMQMNERKSTWKCPVCDNSARYSDLYVDRLFKSILDSPETSNSTDIEFLKDTSWRIVKEDDDADDNLSDKEQGNSHHKVTMKEPSPDDLCILIDSSPEASPASKIIQRTSSSPHPEDLPASTHLSICSSTSSLAQPPPPLTNMFSDPSAATGQSITIDLTVSDEGEADIPQSTTPDKSRHKKKEKKKKRKKSHKPEHRKRKSDTNGIISLSDESETSDLRFQSTFSAFQPPHATGYNDISSLNSRSGRNSFSPSSASSSNLLNNIPPSSPNNPSLVHPYLDSNSFLMRNHETATNSSKRRLSSSTSDSDRTTPCKRLSVCDSPLEAFRYSSSIPTSQPHSSPLYNCGSTSMRHFYHPDHPFHQAVGAFSTSPNQPIRLPINPPAHNPFLSPGSPTYRPTSSPCVSSPNMSQGLASPLHHCLSVNSPNSVAYPNPNNSLFPIVSMRSPPTSLAANSFTNSFKSMASTPWFSVPPAHLSQPTLSGQLASSSMPWHLGANNGHSNHSSSSNGSSSFYL